MQASGHNGQIHFDGVYVTLARRGFLARSSVGRGEKRIPLTSIAAVQWKPAGPMVNGFIQFSVPGGNEVRSRAGRQTTSAVRDENSVLFTRAQMPAFEQIRAAIEYEMGRLHAPAAPTASHVPASASQQLGELAQLHAAGALTDAEFALAKSRVLSGAS